MSPLPAFGTDIICSRIHSTVLIVSPLLAPLPSPSKDVMCGLHPRALRQFRLLPCEKTVDQVVPDPTHILGLNKEGLWVRAERRNVQTD